MELTRIGSEAIFGVYISANMNIVQILEAMNIGLINRPDLVPVFSILMNPLIALNGVSQQIQQKTQLLNSFKKDLKKAKRVLELASKSYTVSATISIGAIDIKPTVNGYPLGTGASSVLMPLKLSVEQATQLLQDLEDEIYQLQEYLYNLIEDFTAELHTAISNLIDKIAEIGNFNITVTI